MKTKVFKSVLLATALLATLPASAYDFMVGSLCYNLNEGGTTISVTRQNWAGASKAYDDGVLPAELIIPSEVTNAETTYTVTAIEYGAFSGCSGLTNVTIPNSITSIGYSAFSWCSGLTNIIIPSSVTAIENYTFEYCKGLKSVTIPNSIITIGNSAFKACSSLTSIAIPNSVKGIGFDAFSGCSSLSNLTIGNSVTTIWNDAFSSCTSLTSVTIPESVIAIGDDADVYISHDPHQDGVEHNIFSGCTSLTSIKVAQGNPVYDSRDNCNAIIKTASNMLIQGCNSTIIPNSVTSIGVYAFKNTGIKNLTIPNSVTKIETYAIPYCKNLTSVTIGRSISIIGIDAFIECDHITDLTWNAINCTDRGNMPTNNIERVTIGDGVLVIPPELASESKITELTIPNSVNTIGVSAFYSCSGLKNVTIPNSVIIIGSSAFEGCTGLTGLTIPVKVSSIGDSAFGNCSGLTSIAVAQENPVYDSRENCNAIIETSTNTLITGCSNTIIPNSVAAIGNYAFFNCVGLTTVTIPDFVTSVGDYAFFNCNGLASATIAATSIGKCAFYNCENLTDLSLGNSVTTIGEEAFTGCINLSSITIPNSVTSIGNRAFSACSNLKNVTIGELITTFGTNVFDGCNIGNLTWNAVNCSTNGDMATSQIQRVTIGNKVETLPLGFVRNSIITEVTIPNSVTDIGSNAFYGCSGLTSLTIPESVTTIGNFAFANCDALTVIKVAQDNNTYDSRYNCNAIIETSTNTLIAGCNNTTIPNSVTAIGKSALYKCTKLTSVTIPRMVTSIDTYAFYGCNGLTNIYSHIVNPDSVALGTWVFFGVNKSNCILNVPTNSIDSYKAANQWKDFYNIVPMSFGEPGDVNGDEVVSGADVTALYNVLLDGAESSGDADVNGDGVVSGADVTALYNLLLGQ